MHNASMGQQDRVVSLAAKIQISSALVLLFPSAMVATVEASAVRLQIPTLGLLGNRLFGGNSWRVSGAQALAAVGVPEYVVAAR